MPSTRYNLSAGVGAPDAHGNDTCILVTKSWRRERDSPLQMKWKEIAPIPSPSAARLVPLVFHTPRDCGRDTCGVAR